MKICKCNTLKCSSCVICFIFLAYSLCVLATTLTSYFEHLFPLVYCSKVMRTTLIASTGVLLGSCILALIGLIMGCQKLILIWLVITFLYWNFNLTLVLVSLLYLVTHKQVRMSVTILISGVLIGFQGFWLALMFVVWLHWTMLVEIKNIPSYMQILADRKTARTEARTNRTVRIATPTEE